MDGRGYYTKIIRFICGFLCSLSFSLLTRQYTTMHSVWRNGCQLRQSYHRCRDLHEETNAKELVLVAVMTHMGTIATRAVGISETWGREIPGKLLFFVGQSENTTTEVNLPLIVLPVADDVYPPQRKAMLMLKYIYENYAERFRWFIRADDDVYVRSDNLMRLLWSINSSDDILLGHPGTGKKGEIGKLGLDDESNFCIGGTGIILSQSVLKKVYPHLDHCFGKTATAHEDSEVGRCLRKFVGVQCPWGYEANELFHQEYGEGSIAYHGELDSIAFEKAVSLHPVKDMRYIYRLHVYYLSLKERINQNRAHTLREHLKYTKQLVGILEKSPLFHKVSTFRCHRDYCGQLHDEDSYHNKDVVPATWTLFRDSQSYPSQFLSTPVHFIQGSDEKGLVQVVEKAKLVIQENARTELYHDLYFGKYRAGYLMKHPIHGNFYEIQYLLRVKYYVDGRLQTVRIPKRAKLRELFGSLLSRLKKRKSETELIDIVLPLSGPFKSFERFMKNMEGTLRKPHEIGRMLIVFSRQVSSPKPFKSLFDSYGKRFPGTKFVWLEVAGVFNSSVALQAAMKYFSNKNNLLFLTEIDIFFDADFLQRCRQNTEAGKIYFPVSFGAYGNVNYNEKSSIYRKNSGQWNLDDFSTFCAYSKDVMLLKEMHAGNVSFTEAPLVEQFVTCRSHVFEIFRVPDPGLFRSVTSPHCQRKQDIFCHSSKEELFDYMFKKKYLIHYL